MQLMHLRIRTPGVRGDPNHFGAPHWPQMFNNSRDRRVSSSVPVDVFEIVNVVMRFDLEREGGVRPQKGLRQAACDFMASLFNNRNSSHHLLE